MRGLKICCQGLSERIMDGSVKVDYISARLIGRDGKAVYKCPSCGQLIEWVIDKVIE